MSIVDTNAMNLTGYDLIDVTYSGYVPLDLIAWSIGRIVIKPASESDNHTLQILTMTTNASMIEIEIQTSASEELFPLFTNESIITAPQSTIQITIKQGMNDSKDLKLYDDIDSTMINFKHFELIVHNNDTNPGVRKIFDNYCRRPNIMHLDTF